ncbi:MAG: hypothetical protein ACK559_05345, partial [bacterium]
MRIDALGLVAGLGLGVAEIAEAAVVVGLAAGGAGVVLAVLLDAALIGRCAALGLAHAVLAHRAERARDVFGALGRLARAREKEQYQ